MRRRISKTELVVHVIEPGTLEKAVFNIFSRIAMQAAYAIFDQHAFRKPGTRRNPINKALFEAWSVALARCDDNDIVRSIESGTR